MAKPRFRPGRRETVHVRRKEFRSGDFQFTPRQLHIAIAIVRGLTNQEIADMASVSLKGIKYHITDIYAKAHAESRVDFIAKWLSGELPLKMRAQMPEPPKLQLATRVQASGDLPKGCA